VTEADILWQQHSDEKKAQRLQRVTSLEERMGALLYLHRQGGCELILGLCAVALEEMLKAKQGRTSRRVAPTGPPASSYTPITVPCAAFRTALLRSLAGTSTSTLKPPTSALSYLPQAHSVASLSSRRSDELVTPGASPPLSVRSATSSGKSPAGSIEEMGQLPVMPEGSMRSGAAPPPPLPHLRTAPETQEKPTPLNRKRQASYSSSGPPQPRYPSPPNTSYETEYHPRPPERQAVPTPIKRSISATAPPNPIYCPFQPPSAAAHPPPFGNQPPLHFSTSQTLPRNDGTNPRPFSGQSAPRTMPNLPAMNTLSRHLPPPKGPPPPPPPSSLNSNLNPYQNLLAPVFSPASSATPSYLSSPSNLAATTYSPSYANQLALSAISSAPTTFGSNQHQPFELSYPPLDQSGAGAGGGGLGLDQLGSYQMGMGVNSVGYSSQSWDSPSAMTMCTSGGAQLAGGGHYAALYADQEKQSKRRAF
jgi:hypothetical protein